VADADVVEILLTLQREWHAEGRSWHAWKPMSLRLGWRWLQLGLRHRWLSLPAVVDASVKGCIDEESAVAADQEPRLNFGLCHGNADPAHFRITSEGKPALIDGEHLYPGYFGYDWAEFTLEFLKGTVDDKMVCGMLEAVFLTVGPNAFPPRLLLSWLRWVNVMNLCRSNALLEVDNLRLGLLRRKQLADFHQVSIGD
jgi:hypothetical protein